MTAQDDRRTAYPARSPRKTPWGWTMGCCLGIGMLVCLVGAAAGGYFWLRDEANRQLVIGWLAPATPAATRTRRPTRTMTPSATSTASPSPTLTASSTQTASATPTPTLTPTATPTPTATAASTQTYTPYPTLVPQTRYTSFSQPHPILGDLRLRQAIAYCTNRDELIASVYPGLEQPGSLHVHSMFHAPHWANAADPAVTQYDYDPLVGQELLEAAGWTLSSGDEIRRNAQGEWLELELKTTTAAYRLTWAEVWERQLSECGIQLIRNHVPSSELFGAGSGLYIRDFEMAAYAWVLTFDPASYAQNLYACGRIPFPENGWSGQNFTGWCNERASQAAIHAAHSLDFAVRVEDYHTLQVEFTRDLPVLPLFARLSAEAVDIELENFISDPFGTFTWNAYEWNLPHADEIVIGLTYEPASLFSMVDNSSDAAALTYLYKEPLIGHALGADWPNLIADLPSEANGGVQRNPVQVKRGDWVYGLDDYGGAAELETGITVWAASGDELVYAGGEMILDQLSVTYRLIEGLVWSDGEPLAPEDLELGYRVNCDLGSENRLWICDQIEEVIFDGDLSYTVRYIPGLVDPIVLEPPFEIFPAHQIVSDGRRLENISPSEWPDLPEVNRTPLGYGPYVPVAWDAGEALIFEANPYYFRGAPAEQRIVVRFYSDATTPLFELANGGAVDILPSTAIITSEPTVMETLYNSAYAGMIQLYLLPSATWEHVDFGLFVR